MLATYLDTAAKYDYLNPRFKAGFAWIKAHDIASLETGHYPVTDGVEALVQRYTTHPESEARGFEAHDHCFDFHYLVKGRENFAVCRRQGLTVSEPYNPVKDIVYFKVPEFFSCLTLTPGNFVAVPPEEAHRPRLAVNGRTEDVVKLVLKIAL